MCLRSGPFGRLWMLSVMQCCFATTTSSLTSCNVSPHIERANHAFRKWRVQSHKIENKWVQNRIKQHKIINACPCINLCIKRTVSACMPPLYGVWASLLSTTPVAASLPLDRVGSSSACAVLLGNSVSVLLSTPAIRAVNCWLQFHSDLESARQRSKAFALKLIWNAKGLKGKRNWVYVFNWDRRWAEGWIKDQSEIESALACY